MTDVSKVLRNLRAVRTQQDTVDRLEARLREYEEALTDLHAEVEMAESVGICLPDRVPSLRAGDLLASKAAAEASGD